LEGYAKLGLGGIIGTLERSENRRRAIGGVKTVEVCKWDPEAIKKHNMGIAKEILADFDVSYLQKYRTSDKGNDNILTQPYAIGNMYDDWSTYGVARVRLVRTVGGVLQAQALSYNTLSGLNIKNVCEAGKEKIDEVFRNSSLLKYKKMDPEQFLKMYDNAGKIENSEKNYYSTAYRLDRTYKELSEEVYSDLVTKVTLNLL